MPRLQCNWCGDYFYGKALTEAITKRRRHIDASHRGAEKPAALGMQPLEAFE